MKSLCIALLLAVSVTITVPYVLQSQVVEVALSTKQITVFANNAASATANAAADNPGWTVLSVKKVNKDPKSRAYRVSMKKK